MSSRCGCSTSTSTSCSCSVVAADGSGVSVTGSGSSGDPYEIGFTSTPAKKAGAIVLITQDPATAVTTGDGKWFFTVPAHLNGVNIVSVHASVPGSPSSSGAVTVQLARVRSGTPADMLSTAVTIDATESSSYTAATPPVINASYDDLATGDFLRVDVDGAGSGAKGLQVIIDYLEP